MPRKGFTLIELLVVIAILAVLAVVVVLTLNPAGLLQESRDANRLSDMGTLNTALGLYSADVTSPSLGNASTVYPSIWDPSATSTAGDQCQGSGMLSLPASYTWQCAASSSYRSSSGQGWIPVNFGAISAGTPVAQCPVDPLNSTSSRRFYTYGTNGSQWEVTASFESSKYKLGGNSDAVTGDGGTLATVYEKGSKLGLEPLDYGDGSLVGLWTLDEGTGTVASDYSGNADSGTWNGSSTNGSYYTTGKVGGYAGIFDGTSTVVNMTASSILDAQLGSMTWAFWFKTTSTVREMLWRKSGGGNANGVICEVNNSGGAGAADCNVLHSGILVTSAATTYNNNAWHHLAATLDRNTNVLTLFADGLFSGSTSVSSLSGINLTSGAAGTISNSATPFGGLIDDVRIYNRALSASEIAAMYSGGK